MQLNGQGINGSVVGKDDVALPFVNVLLLSAADSVLVKGVVAGDNGNFTFENPAPGRFLVLASMTGYKKLYIGPFGHNGSTTVTLGKLVAEEESTLLGEVTVTASKPLFEQTIDRMVVNVQNSIVSAGSTVLEVLQKSPGVFVNRQNGSISMSGKSGVRVMINNKIMQIPLDAVVQLLDGMSAATVEKVELITTPPARYDAEGNAGIIHIVLKETADAGTSGMLGFTAGIRWAETVGGNFNLQHRSRRAAYFMDYSVIRNHNMHRIEIDRENSEGAFRQQLINASDRENVRTTHSLRAGLERKAWKNSTVNFLVTAMHNKWALEAATSEDFQVSADSAVHTDMSIAETNTWRSATAALGLQQKVGTRGELGVSIDYLFYDNGNPSFYEVTTLYEKTGQSDLSRIDLTKRTPINFLIGKADYQHSMGDGLVLEGGFKAVTSSLENDVGVQREAAGTWTPDPTFTSYSTLDEQIAAAYTSIAWQPLETWQVNAGLRYEYTHTRVGPLAKPDSINRRYGYFFPSVFVRKELGKETDWQLSYSRRITRPTYNDIAPFVFFWSPSIFSSGNTALWPALSDAFRLGLHSKNWIGTLQFTHTGNEISILQPENDSATNGLIYRSQNMKYLNVLSYTNTWSFHPASWWELQTNLTGQYQVAETSHLETNVKVAFYSANVNIVNMITLPHDFSIELSGYYQSKSFFGVSTFLAMGSLNAGVQKKTSSGTWRLSVDDILYTNIWKLNTDRPENDLTAHVKYDWHNRFIRLTYSINIGNRQLKSVRVNSGSEEEQGRVR